MTDVIHTETDAWARILATAELLFREIGHRKATLADIDLRMSCANYRFFGSKKSINANVAGRVMREVEHASRVTSTRPRGATRRLHELLLETVHRMKSDRYAGDSKMHEMVAATMQENRDVSKARVDCVIGLAAAVIADGVASSEFSMHPISGTRHLSSLLDKGEHHGRSSET